VDLPDPARAPAGADLIAAGLQIDPASMISGYRMGLFAMPMADELIGWFSPDPRGVLPLDGLRVSKSLRRSLRRFRTTCDERFDEVLAGCADPARRGSWIDPEFVAAFRRLHRMGWAHSIEVWQGDTVVGGLFGVEVGGLFSGESMFHAATDASKVALVALVDRLRSAGGPRLLDVQWWTPHLGSLGVMEFSRDDYLSMLRGVAQTPPAFG
jgi:leucyl/phenylalanyl-tRNA--protein transferase